MESKLSLRPTYLEVDLDRLRYNFKNIRQWVGNDTNIMAVLKADGYGTGAVVVGKVAEEMGMDQIGVATLIEALELRNNGIDLPILVLGYIEENHINILVEKEITQTIYNIDQAIKINDEGKLQGKVAKVHIKIDTGMSRLGLKPSMESLKIIESICELENLEVEGIFTHFIDAENRDKSLCELQNKRFVEFIDLLSENNLEFKMKHILNSGGIMDLIQYKEDMVRVGIIIYGLYPEEINRENIDIKFIASLKSRIADIRYIDSGDFVGYSKGFQAKGKMKVATIPLGYADGYTMEMKDAINPKVGDCEIKVIGNICMDQTMLDVSSVPDLEIGDVVTLFDYDDIDRVLIRWVSQMARRVPRIYVEQGKEVFAKHYLID